MRCFVYKEWFVDVIPAVYPGGGKQQLWDPDFTYEFDYFGWRPHRISVQYSNYAGNRYIWRSQSGAGRFKDGTVSVSYSW